MHMPVRPFTTTSVSSQPRPSPQQSETTTPSAEFSWATYFQLKRQRTNAERLAGVFGGVAAFAGAMYYVVVVMPFDPTVQLFGMLGPEVVGSLGIIFAAVVGRWAGVLAGGEVWAARNRQVMAEFTRRDKSFGRRITEQRAPHQELNVSSQHPDYYAEQVDSVRSYHGWLRLQRNYERGKEAKGAAVGMVAALGRMPGMGGIGSLGSKKKK
ncbi:TIM23 complex component [Gonapodya sp. JEL0774]|nr:TIM23 complex component [Gonapodya sp. JEL0774]